MLKRNTKIKGYATGIDKIDQSWNGLKDGDLYCFCCTFHVDKHNLLAKVIIGLASREISVVIFTLDCSHRDLYKRLIEVIQNFDTSLSGKDPSQRVFEATEKFGSYAIWIQDSQTLSYETLRDRLQSLCYLNKYAVECIIVDNILSMETNFQTPSKEMTLEANLYLLKMIAKDYKIPIIVSTNYDKISLDRILESDHIDKTMIVRTTDDFVDDALNTLYSTITVPQNDFASNLFESVLSVVVA
jgi:replicative DNA helicase